MKCNKCGNEINLPEEVEEMKMNAYNTIEWYKAEVKLWKNKYYYNVDDIRYTIITIIICLITVVDKKNGNAMLTSLLSFASIRMILIYSFVDLIWILISSKCRNTPNGRAIFIGNIYSTLHVFIGLFIFGIFYRPALGISFIGIVLLLIMLGIVSYGMEILKKIHKLLIDKNKI